MLSEIPQLFDFRKTFKVWLTHNKYRLPPRLTFYTDTFLNKFICRCEAFRQYSNTEFVQAII